MNSHKFCLASILTLLVVSGVFPSADLESRQSVGEKLRKINHRENNGPKGPNDLDSDNEIDDTIFIPEEYKSAAVVFTRIVLPQTPIPKIIKMDTAMDVAKEFGHLLTHRKFLRKFIKVATVFIATIITTNLLWPGAAKTVKEVYRDPWKALNMDEYISNGFKKGDILNLVSKRADEIIQILGFDDGTKRKHSICHTGLWLRCTFPRASESIIKWTLKFNFDRFKDNTYAQAFVDGFVDQKCDRKPHDSITYAGCFSNYISHVFDEPGKVKDQFQTEHQHLKPNRAK